MTLPADPDQPEKSEAPGRRRDDLLGELLRNPLDPGYAAAAERRGGAPPPKAGRWLTAAAMLAVGFLLAVAYHQAVQAAPGTSQARDDLVADVHARQQTADDLQRRAAELRSQVDQARDDALADSAGAARLRDLAAGTGTGKVTGDGVAVRIVDAPAPVDPVTGRTAEENLGLVLDRDLQDIANGLWEAGAEAVAVNGQRLTATGTIRAAGGVILVDFRPVTSPYEVTAIGPPDIAARFGDSATAKRFKRYVEEYRMQFSVKQRTNLTLAGAAEPPLKYARTPSGGPSR
ncbi:DUF881 domain-containing protein [Dactylosporangium vinaceum]|uniref:DUF881 domain-containing protein n=1 Tax=Dactylosporangium vinaceum TaxID=53362 RepID=A0ABV5MJD3_9ACTN|nr:DUF881 domain-containing protein [Dactylosporangium vinaceum]UAC02475.1 DUF881 domain-containing protein [Dactylosporangium vinaceum]